MLIPLIFLLPFGSYIFIKLSSQHSHLRIGGGFINKVRYKYYRIKSYIAAVLFMGDLQW